MQKKMYKTSEKKPVTVDEPAVVYPCRDAACHISTETSSFNRWNPNVPFHGTQEEWWEHFHRIEKGNFTPLEEANREFEIWKKEFLASRLI
jgi:hypothetical protein